MKDAGYSKGQCQNCGGHLEFPSAGTGLTIECPHCGAQITLSSEPVDRVEPAGNSPAGSNKRFPVVLGLIVLLLVLATAGVVLNRFKQTGDNPPPAAMAAPPAETNSETPNPPAAAAETNDLFVTGPVMLQKTEGSALIYAVGTIQNNSDRQRFGVKIELDLLDEQDNKIGTTGDYIAILEPHKDWQFRALLAQPKAVKAQVAKIEEQK